MCASTRYDTICAFETGILEVICALCFSVLCCMICAFRTWFMEVICVVCSSVLRDVNNNVPSVLLLKQGPQDLGLRPHQDHDAANGSN